MFRKLVLIEVWKGDPRTDKSARNYADVNIDFDRVPPTDKRLRRTAAEMFREAVVRNAAISHALGKKIKDLSVLNGLFAREGRHTVDCVVKPK